MNVSQYNGHISTQIHGHIFFFVEKYTIFFYGIAIEAA